jgi:hypothetical protein
LLGLRLYTGPLFEFYNSVLRAKGGTVPFGDRYPALKGEQTSGRFVTTIHAVSLRDIGGDSFRKHGCQQNVASLSDACHVWSTVTRAHTSRQVNSGIIKLSALTPVIAVSLSFACQVRPIVIHAHVLRQVYRGAAGMRLPAQLERSSKFGSRLSGPSRGAYLPLTFLINNRFCVAFFSMSVEGAYR